MLEVENGVLDVRADLISSRNTQTPRFLTEGDACPENDDK
jgi:hypothetical protein